MSWLKSEWLLQIAVAAAIFIWKDAIPQETTRLDSGLTLSPVPWVGVLLLKPSKNAAESVAGVVLIHKKMAIVNARDLAKINRLQWAKVRNKTRVMFLTEENQPWYAKVINFTIHPEFDDNTLTTIGVLDLEYDDRSLVHEMLSWPNGINNVSYAGSELFVFGYTDRSGKLEQIVYRMDYVNFYECVHFYIDEELDSQWMRPIKYHCYKVRYKKDSCVFEPGMALVHHHKGIWTLLGMSTLGPGCSLPARFLDFEYFMPWIASKLETRRQTGNTRNFSIWTISDLWRSEGNIMPDDLDAWILTRLNDTNIVLRPITLPVEAHTTFYIGYTPKDQKKQLMYRDRINFTSSTYGSHVIGLGVYGLSLYDLRFKIRDYTCINIIAVCSQSLTKLWYTKGFEQGHMFENLVGKTHPKYGRNYLRHHHYLEEVSWMHYNFDILGSRITNLMFRFEYVNEGYLEISFYGNQTVPSTTVRPERTKAINYMKYSRSAVGFVSRRPITKTSKPTKKAKLMTTNWWKQWWKSSYHKIHEDGGDYDWWKR